MKHLLVGALWVSGSLALLTGTGLSATSPKSTAVIHVMVLDKAGHPVDCQEWTSAIVLSPSHGLRKGLRLESPCCRAEGGVKEGGKESKAVPSGEGFGKRQCCGQIKEFEEGSVKLMVVRCDPAKKTLEGTPIPPEGSALGSDGEDHPHAGACLTVETDDATLKDPKTGAIHFQATLVFTLPSGETYFVKEFDYPAGVYEDALGRLIDQEFKSSSAWEHAQATTMALKIDGTLEGLPALWFKNDSDRQEYERALQECKAAGQRLEAATGKDIPQAAGKCKAALKELRNQARDAQGALAAK